VMLRQLTRIERLVRDLSDLNRIESGELRLERAPVDLYAMLAELCEDFRDRLASEGVEIVLDGPPVHALADIRIQQVFANVIDNAWKHGRKGGRIHVETARRDGNALVRIADEGEGIPAGEAERIFNRFYRIDKSRSQNVPGVGLGLAIAKHLVLAHGGTIRALNRPTGGAVFEIELPISED
jgi:signal transduction histidine kinase